MATVILRKVGSSFVTTVPAELVQDLRLTEGQKFEINKENGRLVLTPITEELDEVLGIHDELLQRYRAAFQHLADS